jgi:DNA modification methylase
MPKKTARTLDAAAGQHALKVESRPLAWFRPDPKNARTHPRKQLAQLQASIERFGLNAPIVANAEGLILAGHARHAAVKALGWAEAPALIVEHLDGDAQRAFAIADNRLAELAGWDMDVLAEEFRDLAANLDLAFPLELTGFDGAALDGLLDPPRLGDDEADRVPELKGPVVTRTGDVWVMGRHRLVCGDALEAATYAAVMGEDRARMVFTDPPYNVEIDGFAGGKGKVERGQFAMASGEMTKAQFTGFLTDTHRLAAGFCVDGAILFSCMDWRHMGEMLSAGEAVGLELKNLNVWGKTNAGMGTFYRSQHELVFVWKVGGAEHVNTFGLGDKGRHRTNLWTYPGANSFGRARDSELEMHPTVKPVAMVVDAIKDVSNRRDVVLDPFGGSGTTLIAAQKTGRRARLIEYEGKYCDVIVRRWELHTGETAVLEGTGQDFGQVAATRAGEALEAA